MTITHSGRYPFQPRKRTGRASVADAATTSIDAEVSVASYSFITFEVVVQGATTISTVTVTAGYNGTSVSYTPHGYSGDTIDYDVSVIDTGGYYDLQLTNNSGEELAVTSFREAYPIVSNSNTPSLSSLAVQNGAYAYYDFSESSGNVLDKSGGGYNLTPAGTPAYQQTDYEGGTNAINLTDGDYLQIADANATPFMTESGDFTMEFVVKLNGTANVAGNCIANIYANSTGSPDQAFALYFTSPTKVGGLVRVASETGNLTAGRFAYTLAAATSDLTTGAWAHIMFQHDTVAGYTKLWFNGVLEGDTNIGKPNDERRASFSEPFRIGDFSSGSSTGVEILMSFAAFYPSLLTSTQVAEHYEAFGSAAV
jgi:hypothetical protein